MAIPQPCAHGTFGEYKPSEHGRYMHERQVLVRRINGDLRDVWQNRSRLLRRDAGFAMLAERWLAETAHVSSLTQVVMHPAYQQIIGMGREALVPILRWMQQGRPGYWFWALETIARETPVTAEMAGRIGEMRQAWLQWGSDRGLI